MCSTSTKRTNGILHGVLVNVAYTRRETKSGVP
jgi:hypothetical protein